MITSRHLRTSAALLLVGAIGLSNQGDISAASLKSSVELIIKGTLSSTLDLAAVSSPQVTRRVVELGNGTGAGQANVMWSDRRTLAPSASEDLDFAGGGLVDALGAAVAPARLRAVCIYSLGGPNGNVNNLTLFGDANGLPLLNTLATTVTLKPGGFWCHTDPSTAGVLVTAGTGDILQIANAAGGTSVIYDVIVIGASS